MKKSTILLHAIALAFVTVVMVSCGSTKVARVDSGTVVDLSGYWNDTDMKIVTDSLISECIASPRVAKFEATNGRPPFVILGKIANKSSEHLDTGILSKRFQTAIINSGVLEFVADASQREQLRNEKSDQAENAYDTAKSIGNEQAADFMLQGTVTTIIDTDGKKKSVRTYQVDMQLIDIESNRIVWQGQNSEIKKLVKRSGAKL